MTTIVPHHSTPSERAERLFDAAGVLHTLVHHRPAYTAADEARAMIVPEEQTAKVVVLRDGEAWLAAIVPACERVDLEKVRDVLGRSPGLRAAAEAEIQDCYPAFEVGALPPLAPFAQVVLDRRLLTYGRVICPAGDHEHSAFADPEAIARATDAVIADVSA